MKNLKIMITSFEAEFKNNGWVKMNMKNHRGAGFLENSLRTTAIKNGVDLLVI